MSDSVNGKREHYHHGNLRQALIDAAIELAAEGGAEQVTVREAARRAGVSPGAPFRHFPNREALMTAVAEEAMSRFRAEITLHLQGLQQKSPLERLGALAMAFLHWAVRNPTHFRIISERQLISFEASDSLVRGSAEVRGMTEMLLDEARGAGLIAVKDIPLLALVSRAFVYGLARMQVDGQMAQWNVSPEATDDTLGAAADLFVRLLAGTAEVG